MIREVQYREVPFSYTDVVIEFAHPDNQEQKYVLKASLPSAVSANSKLGKLLLRFGAKLEVGQKIDPDKVLIGKRCRFQVMNEETKNGIYAKILPDSVRAI